MRQHRFRYWLSLSLSVILSSGQVLSVWAETDWYMLKTNGKTIGKVSIQSYAAPGALGDTTTEVNNTNHFARQGSPFEMKTLTRFVESRESGKPLRFSYQYDLGPQRFLEAEGQLSDRQLDLRMIREQTLSSTRSPITADQFLFPGGAGIQKVYRQHYQDEPGARFRYQTLNLGLIPEVMDTEVTSLNREMLALATGETKPVRKFEIKNPTRLTDQTYEWRDAQGKLYKAQSLGSNGMEMVYASQRQVRQADRDSLDLIATSSVLSNKIPQPRIVSEALYRISPINGQTIQWESAFPESDSQEIIEANLSGLQNMAPDALYLKVYHREPSDSSIPYPIAGDAKYLQSTPYVQSADPDIDSTAVRIVGKEQRAYYAARLLRQWVYKNIARKDLTLGFASAKETLLSRQGDCTEHAALLAALTRALGIPSRVAIGLIYVPEGDSALGRFVYHMWNEVYIGDREKGEWIPLDATNPEALTDATHIKIADSALTQVNDLMTLTQQVVGVMGKMKIDVMKALSPAESALVVGGEPGALQVEIPRIDIAQFDIQAMSRKSIKHFRVQLPPVSLSLDAADGLFTYGVEALSKKQYDHAQQAFQKAFTKVHRPIDFYLLGEKLAGIEMYGLAQEAFQQALTGDRAFVPLVDAWKQGYLPASDLPDALNWQFMEALYTSDPAEATTLLKQVNAQAPRFAPAYRHLGEISKGDTAITALKQATTLAPKDFRNQESLGDAYMAQGKYRMAAAAYRSAHHILQGNGFSKFKPWLNNTQAKLAIATGASALARNKRDAEGWLMVGKGLLWQNRQEEALQAFTNAWSLSPSYADAQVYRFQMALKASDWKKVYANKDRLAGFAQHNALAASLLGQYQMRTRQYGPAVQTLRRAISMNPHAPEAYIMLSQVYLRMAEQKAVSKHPKTAKSANIYRESALTTLRRGAATLTDSSGKRDVTLALARLLLEKGKSAEALQRVEGLLTNNPVDGKAVYLKGKAQFYAGDYATARTTLETALAINPNDPEVLCQLGHVAKEEGRDAIAVDFYQHAYKADPLNEEAGMAYRNLLTQLQIVGQKPPEYLYLTDDEHDYLVQLLYQGKQIKLNTLEYLRKLASLPGYAGQVAFSVKGVESIESFKPLIGNLYNAELSGYQRLQSMNVPGRFAEMHYRVSQVSLNHLEIFNEAIKQFPTLDQDSGKARAYQRLLNDIAVSDKLLGQEMFAISNRLPELVFKSLISEAQLTRLTELNREISYLQSQLAKKQEKPEGPAKAPIATPDPAQAIGKLPSPEQKAAKKP